MSWVRYDDGFHEHDKVLPLRAECVEALALHILANCWTSRSDRPGFVPAHLPVLLIGDREKADLWCKALVKVRLWRKARGGWEFVNHEKYRASAKRQTPGTPTDLSEKRAEAGRKGGKAAQQRKRTVKQTVQQNKQDAEQPSSKPCSPVVASNEATPVPEPVPTTSGLPEQTADVGALVGHFIEACKTRPPSDIVSRIGKGVRALVAEGVDPEAIRGGLTIAAERGLHPSSLSSAVHEHLNARPRGPRFNAQDEILRRSMERARAQGATA